MFRGSPGACLALALALAAGQLSAGFPTFPSNLPGASRVPCSQPQQCPSNVCVALGHVDCRGGDYPGPDGTVLNQFGKDFATAGFTWTQELCQKDSDGDGRTNGQELGDPCCVWSIEKPLEIDTEYALSHPGRAEDTADGPLPTEQECATLREQQGGSQARTKEEEVATFFQPGEEQKMKNFTITRHNLLARETVYSKFYFDLPLDAPMYVTGFFANIDNKVRNHHMVLYLCKQPRSALSKVKEGLPDQPPPEEPVTQNPDSCDRLFYAWAPGSDAFAMPSNMMYDIKNGKKQGAYKSLLMEVHYNNVDLVDDEFDASSFEVYYTTKPRSISAAIFWTGSVTGGGVIPPKSLFYSGARCVLRLEPGCDSIEVVGHFPHAHYLGTHLFAEQHRADAFGHISFVRDVGRDPLFSYERQYTRMLDEPATLRDGDIITSTCIYNSTSRDAPTPSGLDSEEEMCLNQLLYHPAECFRARECNGMFVSGLVPEGIDPTQTVRSSELYELGTSPDFETLVEEGGMDCNMSATAVDGAAAQNDYTEDDTLATWMDTCKELFENEVRYDPLKYKDTNCSRDCIDYLSNLGACSATELSEDFDKFSREWSPLLLQGGTPITVLPPNCSQALTQQLESTVTLPPGAEQPDGEVAPSAGSGAVHVITAASAAAVPFVTAWFM